MPLISFCTILDIVEKSRRILIVVRHGVRKNGLGRVDKGGTKVGQRWDNDGTKMGQKVGRWNDKMKTNEHSRGHVNIIGKQ
jgi:hypothetical protein